MINRGVGKDSEDRYRQVVEGTSDLVTQVDGKGQFIYVNHVAEKVFGVEKDKLIGMSAFGFIHPDDRDKTQQWFNQCVKSLRPQSTIENRQINKRTGEVFTMHWTSNFYYNDQGKVDGVNGIARDMTERIRTEEELAERAMLAEVGADIGKGLTIGKTLRQALQLCCEALVNHLRVSFARIWTLNGDQDVLELQASEGLYSHIDGKHSRIPVGSFKIGLIASERKPHLTNQVIGDPQISDQDWAKREGIISFAGHPLIIEDRVVGVMGMFSQNPLTDVIKKALSNISDHIALGIDLKTAEMERENLNRKLEQRRQEVEDILRITSHDLRTPLAVIQGYCQEMEISANQILSEIERTNGIYGLGSKITTHVKDIEDNQHYIRSNIRKMNSLFDGLLKLSRSGRADLHIKTLDIQKLVADVRDSLEYDLQRAKVKFEVSGLPDCRGDETQVNQVFTNLISNALKYIEPSRPGRIRVSGKDENGHSVYCVEDNGMGISDKNQQKIFEIFYQLDPNSGGVGLGLSIVKKIIDRHTGKIWVESEQGKGSRFYFELPAANV